MEPIGQLQDQLALAALFTWGWQGAKSVPWISWVGEHAPNVSRAFSAAFAALVAAGFTWSFQGDIVQGGTLTIAVPTLAAWMEAGRLFVTQFALQHSLFKVAFGKPNGANTNSESEPPLHRRPDGTPGREPQRPPEPPGGEP